MRRVEVLKPVLVSNKERAKENRKKFDSMNSLVINIIASPGAGKTSFIHRIVEHFKKDCKILIIEGDIKGQVDSKFLAKLAVDVIQINTLTECHLDAFMIAQVLPKIKKKYDLVLVENVGNLVCPAEFEIGEDFKLAILSTPEGDDKALKYPLLFYLAKVVVINKCDLLPYVNFNINKAKAGIKTQNPKVKIFDVSAKTGRGFEDVYKFLKKELSAKKKSSKK
ncbi:hydrogenase nickel incorporation protein HypB [candidate division WOR-3 bacterium]|jgi:hydrogenase nickel incorporation protein HypB|nr:hydrogenase nickel incorporation protein HypB [candidate division WOR-3 bacterium]